MTIRTTYHAHLGCQQCGRPGHKREWARFYQTIFDVTRAREIALGAATTFVTPAQLEKYGIRREPQGPSDFSARAVPVFEEHLTHIPAEMIDRPILFATLPTHNGILKGAALIDGSHAATIRVRRGDLLIPAIELTLEQSAQCCLRGWPERQIASVGVRPSWSPAPPPGRQQSPVQGAMK